MGESRLRCRNLEVTVSHGSPGVLGASTRLFIPMGLALHNRVIPATDHLLLTSLQRLTPYNLDCSCAFSRERMFV